jgi:MFS family permease
MESGALQEWRRDWSVPLVAMLGAGAATLHFSTISIFIKPIMADTHWSLSTVTACFTVYSIVALIVSPILGWLLDRVGAGKIGRIGVLTYMLSFAAVGILPHSPLQWLIIWGVVAAVGMFSRSPVWVSPVAKRFHASRGLALAVVGAGLGFYSIFMPALTQASVTALGWRMAYVAIAGIVFVVVWPLTYLVFGRKDFDAVSNARAAAHVASDQLPGPAWRAALRSRYMLQLTAAALMGGAGVLGVLVHLAPMLQEKGMTPATAAAVLGALGVSSLVGRFVTGWMLDRFSARLVSAFVLLTPLAGCALYLQFSGGVAAALAIVAVFGWAAGAETDMVAFLAARYLGLRSFGVCFSIMYSVQSLGGGSGPLFIAQLRSFYGDYDNAMLLQMAELGIGVLLLLTLGPPPDYKTPATAAPDEGLAPASA